LPRRANGTTPTERFVKLDHALLDSEAWHHLSPHAVKLLLAIWRRHDGKNNGAIPCSVSEARRLLGCRKERARQCFTELERLGFIRLTKDSAFNVKTKEAREWELTAKPTNDAPAGRDFEQWTSGR